MLIACSRVMAAMIAIFGAVAPVVAEVFVAVPDLKLTMSLPDGFEPTPEPVPNKRIVKAFVLKPKSDDENGIMVMVERLGGTIDRRQIRPKLKLKDGRELDAYGEKWKSFTVDVVKVPEQVNDVDWISYKAALPLKPEAVHIIAFADRSREKELQPLLQTILATADGPTNWLTEDERGFAAGQAVGYLLVFVVGPVIYVIWRRRSQLRNNEN